MFRFSRLLLLALPILAGEVALSTEVNATGCVQGSVCHVIGDPPPSPTPVIVGPGGGIDDGFCTTGCLGGGGVGPGSGWVPTYDAYYTEPHSCTMWNDERLQMVADAVRADVMQEHAERGQVGARRLEIRGYDGSRELFDIVPGTYRDLQLQFGVGFVSLVPGSCQSGSSGT